MPIYEYEPLSESCDLCGGRFSDLQSMREPAHEKCPTCEKPCKRAVTSCLIGNGAVARRPEPKAKAKPAAESANPHANHNCAAVGCYKRADKLLKDYK